MKLPPFLMTWLCARLGNHLHGRLPDEYIGGRERPYLVRDWIFRSKVFGNIYHHSVVRSDDDRALHDHPWPSISIILSGHYVEEFVLAGGVHIRKLRETGDIVFRRASTAHPLEIEDEPCRTLFITGPKVRSWGFHCPKGWVHWRLFCDPDDPGSIGRGCGEDA